MIGEWTWSWYLQLLFLGILLFASGALVLPSESQQRSGDLLEDFREHGRLGLLPLTAYHILWIPTSYRIDRATIEAGNFANLILAVLILIAFASKRVVVQAAAVATFGVVVVWASIFGGEAVHSRIDRWAV